MLIVTGLILAFVWFFKRSATTVHRTEAESQTEKLDAPEQLNNPREKIRSRSKQETHVLQAKPQSLQEMSKKGDNKGSDGFDAYQVIVTNNLFRPLGWTEKRSGPSYRLIGTVIKDEGLSFALISDDNTKQTYYVAVGDKIGNATVEKIASKKVALRQQNGGLLEPELGPLAFLSVKKEIPTEGGGSGGPSQLASSKGSLEKGEGVMMGVKLTPTFPLRPGDTITPSGRVIPGFTPPGFWPRKK